MRSTLNTFTLPINNKMERLPVSLLTPSLLVADDNRSPRAVFPSLTGLWPSLTGLPVSLLTPSLLVADDDRPPREARLAGGEGSLSARVSEAAGGRPAGAGSLPLRGSLPSLGAATRASEVFIITSVIYYKVFIRHIYHKVFIRPFDM